MLPLTCTLKRPKKETKKPKNKQNTIETKIPLVIFDKCTSFIIFTVRERKFIYKEINIKKMKASKKETSSF